MSDTIEFASPRLGNDTSGHVEVILGPMFSGKTTELVRRIRKYTVAKHHCIVIKYSRDTRYTNEDETATHDRTTIRAKPCSSLEEVEDIVKDYDVVGIDEGQFFATVVEFSEKMANLGKIVIVACLDGTFQRKPFGRVLELIPLAESVTKLNSVCMRCYNEAAFTKRLGCETEVEVIGGADKYIAVCRRCFNSKDSTPMPSPIRDSRRKRKESSSSMLATPQSQPSKDRNVRSKIQNDDEELKLPSGPVIPPHLIAEFSSSPKRDKPRRDVGKAGDRLRPKRLVDESPVSER